MCYSVLTLCPDCRSNIRHLNPCVSGTIVSSSFKYTDRLTADVCSSTGALLSVHFKTGICKDCIRYAKARQAARANLQQWQNELDDITSRATNHGRKSALRPAAKHPKKPADDSGGRKALLRLWYEEAKVRNLMGLDSARIVTFTEEIDAPTRLRRAIHLHDLILVRRIIKSNPSCLRNPDFEDRNNSSLHLAAILGHVDIAQFLVEADHEAHGISKNLDGNTPLMEAVDAKQEEVALYLGRMFTRCISWKNRLGLDATMIASRAGLADLLSLFISLHESPSELLSAKDVDGNTALHYASGYGQRKCLHVLLTSGADPMVENNFRCTPAMGSRTKDIGTYFLTLVRDIEIKKREGRELDKEMAKRQQSGVRVVSNTSSIGQAISSHDDEEDAVLERPPGAVFGSVDSGRQSPARMRRSDGRMVYGGPNRSRAGSYEQQP